MKRKEKQRQFHDSLINMLYASPLPPPQHNQFDDQTLNFAREIVNSDSHRINTDELEEEDERGLSVSSDEHDELGFQKLTRAQRKRLRRKKLKEAASHRRQIIGPQLLNDDQIDGCSEVVRRNAAEKPESRNDCKQLPRDDESDGRPEGVRQNAAERPETRNDYSQLPCDEEIDGRPEGVRRNAAERSQRQNDYDQKPCDGHLEGVRRNAAESRNDHNHRGESSSCIKVNRRRMSKKIAMENTKTLTMVPEVNPSPGPSTVS